MVPSIRPPAPPVSRKLSATMVPPTTPELPLIVTAYPGASRAEPWSARKPAGNRLSLGGSVSRPYTSTPPEKVIWLDGPGEAPFSTTMTPRMVTCPVNFTLLGFLMYSTPSIVVLLEKLGLVPAGTTTLV